MASQHLLKARELSESPVSEDIKQSVLDFFKNDKEARDALSLATNPSAFHIADLLLKNDALESRVAQIPKLQSDLDRARKEAEKERAKRQEAEGAKKEAERHQAEHRRARHAAEDEVARMEEAIRRLSDEPSRLKRLCDEFGF
jgi:chromosome segregation ATPase